MDEKLTPKEQWEKLRQEFMQKIDEIDKQVPWSEVEPDWWVHMQKARRAASGIAK